jgi:hypothetical protein
LPKLRQPALSTVPSLVQKNNNFLDDTEIEKEFDVFISHAYEEKEEVVRPLAQALRLEGLKVWYDEFELKIGDSFRRKIDKGFAKSKFGNSSIIKIFYQKGLDKL